MNQQKTKLIVEENTLYEIDLECMKKKERNRDSYKKENNNFRNGSGKTRQK